MALQPIPRGALSDAVYDQIRVEIVRGHYPAGQALPSERELAQVLGVSRGAIREAMRLLEQSGLVDSRPGMTTRVLDYRRNAGLELLPQLLVGPDGDLDRATIAGVLEMRSALAPDVARAATARRTVEELRALQSLADQHTAATGNVEEQQRLAIAFWDVLVDASHNMAYRLAYNSLRRVYELVREAMAQVLQAEIVDSVRLQQICGAVAEGDAQTAAEVSRALCERGRRGVSEAFAILDGWVELEDPDADQRDLPRPVEAVDAGREPARSER